MGKEIVDATNHALCREAFRLKQNIEIEWLRLGQVLKEIRDTGAWEGEYESFDNQGKYNFVEDLGLRKEKANKLILIVERVVGNGITPERLAPIGWPKLAEVLPKITDHESAEKYVGIAETIPTEGELRKKMREIRTGISEETCHHENTYVLKICRSCGLKEHIQEMPEVYKHVTLK